MKLTPSALPRRTELWETVLETLRNAIVTGELPPGTRLIEADLAETLRVSRWPVRQAIAQLEHENLVVRYRNRGAYVIEFTAADIGEIFVLRRLLEEHAAARAAERFSLEYEEQLTQSIDALSQRIELGDTRGAVAPDIQFHRTLFEMAGSTRLSKMWETLVAPIYALLMIRNVRREPIQSERLPSAHRAILDAIRGGDAEQARAAMADHLNRSEVSMRRLGLGEQT